MATFNYLVMFSLSKLESWADDINKEGMMMMVDGPLYQGCKTTDKMRQNK